MPRTNRAELNRKQAAVTWEDVWSWAESLYNTYGYSVKVSVTPPLPSKVQVRAIVEVKLTRIRFDDPTRDSSTSAWRNARYDGKSVEAVALQLLVEIDAKLERQAWEAERAAVENGSLLW